MVYHKEEFTITDVSLNEPINPRVFTLAGMDIPDGTGIAGNALERKKGKRAVVKDGKITEITTGR